jgi:hypothetical protein
VGGGGGIFWGVGWLEKMRGGLLYLRGVVMGGFGCGGHGVMRSGPGSLGCHVAVRQKGCAEPPSGLWVEV